MNWGKLTLSLVVSPVSNFIESFIDNVVRDTISCPAIGGIVYCDLLAAEHTGIYVGDGNIVHLDGDGLVERVSAKMFLERLGGFNPAISIYTACHATEPVGLQSAAEYAKRKVGTLIDYNVLTDNCHRFTTSCLLNEKASVAACTLTAVKLIHFKKFGICTWRVWNLA